MFNTPFSLGRVVLLSAVAAVTLSSCIKEEAQNAECDITGVSLNNGASLLRQPVFNGKDITIYANTSDTIFAPEFSLSDGATISPANGTPRQFFKREIVHHSEAEGEGMPDDTLLVAVPQQYTVTSEDGLWHKTYNVSLVNNATPTDFHFDNVRYYNTGGKNMFQIFSEDYNGNTFSWGSGNAGAMITLAATNPSYDDYPTSQADDGVSGKCAKLTTISTGVWGNLFGAPIAAGNLFLGSFEVNMQNMPKSTHFGIPLITVNGAVPKSLSGYYKYQPGKTFIKLNDAKNGTVEVPGKTDDFAIYAIVFEVTEDVQYIDGTNSLTSPNIVLKAEVKKEDHVAGNDWVKFDIPFEPQNGKTIDKQKLINGAYSISIILSSSEGGALFQGAVGSTLYVDEFHINY